eukprot:1005657-Prorocentrum_minimum.AAC.1
MRGAWNTPEAVSETSKGDKRWDMRKREWVVDNLDDDALNLGRFSLSVHSDSRIKRNISFTMILSTELIGSKAHRSNVRATGPTDDEDIFAAARARSGVNGEGEVARSGDVHDTGFYEMLQGPPGNLSIAERAHTCTPRPQCSRIN